VDSLARQAPDDLETVNENLGTAISKILNETDFKGVAWIGHHQEPLVIQK